MKAVPLALIILLAGPALAAVSAEEHVGRNAEKGDPARWYEPADTPREKHRLAMQEAKAALAEALKDCRADVSADRKACEADARAQYEFDTRRARNMLARDGQG